MSEVPLPEGRLAVAGLLVIGAVAVLISVFMTGEAGARTVWGG